MEKTFSVSGLHCNACVNRVQKALSGMAGVEQVQVDLASATVKIYSVEEISTDAMNALLEDFGDYRLHEKT
ncbi:MAG: heavy-metal-associated domain-containing protein [Bacteroidales bacterium]|nr:heavy-metal-associated domain-containing protein [Bacteroidales bacterium]